VSHPARGPVRSTGSDGKANRALRPTRRSCAHRHGHEEAAPVSHPARAPVRSTGSDGKANRALRPTRRSSAHRHRHEEAAPVGPAEGFA